MRYILLTEKSWHKDLFYKLKQRQGEEWILISSKSDFNLQKINDYNPEIIFIPHWSYIISKEIHLTYNCIVFHMTDLPYGRGGSPLQNLILNGNKSTKISALKVESGIDTGDIYLKKDLSLSGTAKEIFERATPIIYGMIDEIIDKKLSPSRQQGTPVYFKRRKPEESSVDNIDDLNVIYNYIRMLDCEGYPNAFIVNDFFIFEFTNPQLFNNEITASVRITKK